MEFAAPLEPGILLRRYKRFLADVRLPDGRQVTVHCPNPGSMRTCSEPGSPVWLSESSDPRRKLSRTLEVVVAQGTSVYVNPVRVNRVVEEALRSRRLPELCDHVRVRREVGFPRPSGDTGRRSRVDFLLEYASQPDAYVEVKNVTLDLGRGRSAFPDAVTERGARHLHELIQVRRAGARAVLFYCASRSDARSVEAAQHVDPEYAGALQQAVAEGVEVLSFCCRVEPDGVSQGQEPPAPPRRVLLGPRIPVL